MVASGLQCGFSAPVVAKTNDGKGRRRHHQSFTAYPFFLLVFGFIRLPTHTNTHFLGKNRHLCDAVSKVLYIASYDRVKWSRDTLPRFTIRSSFELFPFRGRLSLLLALLPLVLHFGFHGQFFVKCCEMIDLYDAVVAFCDREFALYG